MASLIWRIYSQRIQGTYIDGQDMTHCKPSFPDRFRIQDSQKIMNI
jgi:hypothetical protein